ncbi:MAG: hypothetical protein CMA27_04715 [Euryarchaeota archaeon]|nr:hypothetical protein [Euryarchaeota archaeon]|tara:strand:+ start:3400 stop:3849 length:450 start_codon:yes stop_codon:yes gene_type:complete
MKNKKPIIEYFRIASKFNISGGITDIEWRSKNNFLAIIYFGFKVRFYFNTTNTSLFIYKPEKINLISIGLFGITTSRIFVRPIEVEKEVQNRKFLDNRDVFKTNSKLNKPIINDFYYKKEIDKSGLIDNGFFIKNINFKINSNKLNYTE